MVNPKSKVIRPKKITPDNCRLPRCHLMVDPLPWPMRKCVGCYGNKRK